jgi:uncharacterized protein YukE
MMSLEGMDVDQAQGLARRLEANARALANVAAALAGLTAELSHYWRGPASATFQQQWATRHRPALSNAAQSLADMHARLVANVQQQIRASAADSSMGSSGGASSGTAVRAGIGGLGAALGTAMSGVRRDWDALEKGAGWEGLAQTPLDKIREVAGQDDVPVMRDGRIVEEDYGKEWTQLMKLDHDSPFLKYKESPILNSLHNNVHVRQADHILTEAHAPAVLDKLDKAGKGLGYVATAVSAGEAGDEALHHQYAKATGSTIDATSSALMNSDNPVGFLAGFDIALIKKDTELAQQIDWKQGIPNPFDAATFRSDYIPTFKQLPGQLVSTLAGII